MKIKNLPLAMMMATMPLSVFSQQEAPAAIAPLPTTNQVAWQQMETYAFIHYGLNTYDDSEWGYGNANPQIFNPSRLDCEQWVRTLKAGGMKGVIITAKHHDGFCMWPTKYTDYSIRNTPYKDGKGDIVGELAAACQKYGMKLGVYLSPWDRHQAFYGTPFYREYYYAQMEELFTQYGNLFEVWLDGANGGDGWYGGANEKRQIDRRTYYEFDRVKKLVEKYQPQAVIFSDGGPGCRWVGNEKGRAGETNWSLLNANKVYAGYEKMAELNSGHANGDTWVPAECDVSIRPGWFYHDSENDKVKSVADLMDIYYTSVGRNSTFLLNVPVDKDGLIHPTDSIHLVNFRKALDEEFRVNLLKNAKVKASSTRHNAFGAANVTDGNFDTYWATKDGETSGTLTFTFKRQQSLNRLMIQEYIPLGQRVRKFRVEYQYNGNWKPLPVEEQTTTIGYRRLLRFNTIQAKQIRVTFDDARGPLCINEMGAYLSKMK
ncbi:MAG: alpha-L-fucosidase [Prevotella sp.]|nr:alpha-L-fucosidase [Prevotella sp.]